MYRQGDVLIEAVATIPADAVKQKPGQRIILALGEATGHHHSLEADAADWWKAGEEQFLELSAPAEVTHQEHGAIALPAGRYRVTRQREYSPEAIRNVAD
ncbi:MAG: hypothetical protein KGL39_28810 [Patescibacteria group bacterium]|nr:hypothetical protein [Patescibacteria group bacterium]